MQKLVVFNSMSVDGYFTDANADMSFAYRPLPDIEWDAFVEGNASGGGMLLFGRITYQLMAGYWPTALAAEQLPIVAERMNNLPKVVFSRTLDKAAWVNTTLVKDDLASEIRKLKNQPGEHMTILGSGSIIAQLAPLGLIDQYQLVVIPVALGRGRTMFEGMSAKLPMRLASMRAFRNGNVLMCYDAQAG